MRAGRTQTLQPGGTWSAGRGARPGTRGGGEGCGSCGGEFCGRERREGRHPGLALLGAAGRQLPPAGCEGSLIQVGSKAVRQRAVRSPLLGAVMQPCLLPSLNASVKQKRPGCSARSCSQAIRTREALWLDSAELVGEFRAVGAATRIAGTQGCHGIPGLGSATTAWSLPDVRPVQMKLVRMRSSGPSLHPRAVYLLVAGEGSAVTGAQACVQ